MTGFGIRWVVNAFALWVTDLIFTGIVVDSVLALFAAAFVLGILNAVLRPLIVFLTLPINLLTLGLFTFVINGFMLKLTAALVAGFHVHGFFTAVFGALVLSAVSFLLSVFVSDSGRIEYIYVERG